MRVKDVVRVTVRSITLTLSVASPLLMIASHALGQTHGDVANRGGVFALLTQNRAQIAVRWRFYRPQSRPLTDISATIQNQPLGVPRIERYPGPKSHTSILLLLDVSDPRRAVQIRQDKLSLFQIAGRATTHDKIAIVDYAAHPQLLVPRDGKAPTLVNMVAGLPPVASRANLAAVLKTLIGVLARAPVDRRAIFIFSDGHTDDALAPADLITRARRANISLNFLLSPSQRVVNVAALTEIADRTGGEVIPIAQRPAFVRAPFALLESGGTAYFPLGSVHRYFWEGTPQVKVALHYGNRELDLATTVPATTAGISETLTYLFRKKSPALLILGALALGFVGGAGTFAMRPATRKRGKSDASRDIVLAVLQDTANGTLYPIRQAPAKIGRAADNDVVLNDKSVSRLHATFERMDDGSFSIQNRSDLNPLLVNNKEVDKQPLSDGDLISLGETTLRFARGGSE